MRLSAADHGRPWIAPCDARQAATHGDEYAWRLFVALNWPADTRQRRADPGLAFGADGPVVWETWQNTTDIFLEDGADPGPWVATPARADAAVATERRFETLSLKDFPNARHIVDGRMVPLVDPAANARRLTEIRLNRAAFEYVRAHELYDLDGQLRAAAARRPVSFPARSIEVKAKWRPVRDDERNRYHTIQVRRNDGSLQRYGLTALHIVSKVLPQWFWATFEHVDNPTFTDADGWQLPSRDRFACRGTAADCNRTPAGIGLDGTPWQYYRLRGTMSDYVAADGGPQLLANSELEAGLQRSSSCMTCHARSVVGVAGDTVLRLPVFGMPADDGAPLPLARRGYVGVPDPAWFVYGGQAGHEPVRLIPLDFVWSLSKARPRRNS